LGEGVVDGIRESLMLLGAEAPVLRRPDVSKVSQICPILLRGI
jgi:hypothetical protein